MEEKIPVLIFGQTYEIVGNASESLYYNSLARYVEDKMREIQQNTNVVSTQKVAILAALNIADDLFRERDHKNSSGQNADKKIQDMMDILDQALYVSAGESAGVKNPQVAPDQPASVVPVAPKRAAAKKAADELTFDF